MPDGGYVGVGRYEGKAVSVPLEHAVTKTGCVALFRAINLAELTGPVVKVPMIGFFRFFYAKALAISPLPSDKPVRHIMESASRGGTAACVLGYQPMLLVD